jgi:hypothetical protein
MSLIARLLCCFVSCAHFKCFVVVAAAAVLVIELDINQ